VFLKIRFAVGLPGMLYEQVKSRAQICQPLFKNAPGHHQFGTAPWVKTILSIKDLGKQR
jgi:hypothetical protein